ncbi:MAG: hypothetical protein LBT09_04810 [Planctomycetaceae bacterium]|jgi:hypothetical protein|nr:hypothetical protein [Planctomycetaceae bacterium]
MTLLSREIASESERFEMVEVDVTEWGKIDPETGKPEKTTVFVRELSGREKDAFESGLITIKGRKQKINLDDIRARMAVLVCCDEKQKPIFNPEDFSWLTKKSSRPLTRIYNAAKELNDLSDEDEEELLKN